jgi:hypothetical protein
MAFFKKYQSSGGGLLQKAHSGVSLIWWILALILLMSFFFNITKFIKRTSKAALNLFTNEDEEALAKEQQNNLIDPIESSIRDSNLSENESWYKGAANDLESAMRGFGTNERAVIDILFKLKNNDDAKKLVSEFGYRITGWPGSEALNLLGWFGDEFTSFGNPGVVALVKAKFGKVGLAMPW